MNDKIEILYTDNEIVIAVKPSGVNSTDIPGGMPELLRTELNCQEIRTVHRLDQTVSGLMLFSRSRYIARKLSEEIGDHRFHKEYLAVIHGQSESDHGIMEDYLHRNREERKTYAVPEGTEDSQYARLRYQVIGKKGEDSLVRIANTLRISTVVSPLHCGPTSLHFSIPLPENGWWHKKIPRKENLGWNSLCRRSKTKLRYFNY